MPPGRTASGSKPVQAYELTELGRQAWQSQDKAIPRNFRLMLWLLDSRGPDYLRDLATRFSSQSLWGLLGELQELKFIKRVRGGRAKALPQLVSPEAAFAAEEARKFEMELQSASHSLLKGRVYIPEHRRKRRTVAKAPSETVVLVVEDDPDQLALADLRVSMAGYQVWAADSAAALRKTLATKQAPDILVLDVMLPDGDGFEILRELRADAAYVELPVVLLTAKTDIDDILTGLKVGADAYLTKPYSKDVLAQTIEDVLRLDHAADE